MNKRPILFLYCPSHTILVVRQSFSSVISHREVWSRETCESCVLQNHHTTNVVQMFLEDEVVLLHFPQYFFSRFSWLCASDSLPHLFFAHFVSVMKKTIRYACSGVGSGGRNVDRDSKPINFKTPETPSCSAVLCFAITVTAETVFTGASACG